MPATPTSVNILLFILGLLIIIKGSDLFLDNAIWMARASGLSQIVVGATIVSACTTLPELVSSCTASIKGTGDMALGNAVGSVICNTGVILGILLVLTPAVINRRSLGMRGVFLLVLLVLAGVFALPASWLSGDTGMADTSVISRFEGMLLLIGVVIYLAINYHDSMLHAAEMREKRKLTELAHQHEIHLPPRVPLRDWFVHLAWFGGGAVLVGIGAFMLVEFGQRLARNLGVSDAVVSLLFVAFGTSLPELFTAVNAVRKKAEEISVGNIIGANVLNITLVTGSSATIRPLTLVDSFLLRVDIPVALVMCTFVTVIGLMAGRLGRRTGLILIMGYVAYLISMVGLGRMG